MNEQLKKKVKSITTQTALGEATGGTCRAGRSKTSRTDRE